MEVVKSDVKPKKVKNVYDRTKRYTWTKEDKFVLTGDQFGMVLNAFRAVLTSEMARVFDIVGRANEGIEEAMKTAVEAGFVKEIPPDK